MNKELKELVALLKREGFDVRPTRNGHYTVRSVTGEYVTTLSGTPSDHRSHKNANAAIKRARRAQAEEEAGKE